MIVRIEDTRLRGRAVRLDESVDSRVVARAVREGEATASGRTITVLAREPHPVHERVGHVYPEMGLRVRTALAEAARARGLSTPLDGEIREVRGRLRELTVDDVDTAAQRRAVAEASADTDRLRETVAERRGELLARREAGRDTDHVSEEFRDAARALSEAETSAAAARQNLDRRRREARATRDRLERRMALEDDLANLRRRARERLVERLRGAYACGLAAVPGGPDTVADPFDVDPVTAALAVARVADLDGPVVLACDRFPSARAASAWLGAPVVRVW